jgi:hypothetical protein
MGITAGTQDIPGEVVMRGRPVCVVFGAALFALLLLAACSGNGPDGLPTKGEEVCDRLNAEKRFRYTFTFAFDSPKQPEPIDPTIMSDYALGPSSPDFKFEQTHTGAFQENDRFQLEITAPGQAGFRAISIGGAEWYELDGNWQEQGNPGPFPFAPQTVCQAIVAPLDLAGGPTGVETVGDTAAQHLRIERAPIAAAAPIFGPQSDMARLLKEYDVDLWLSEKDGRLVKVEARSKANFPFGREFSGRFSLEVGSFNDKEIEIEPPA